MTQERKYLTEREASTRSGLSRAWHQKKRWDGSGPPFVKLEQTILYPIDKYDDWFASRERQSTSEYPTRSPKARAAKVRANG